MLKAVSLNYETNVLENTTYADISGCQLNLSHVKPIIFFSVLFLMAYYVSLLSINATLATTLSTYVLLSHLRSPTLTTRVLCVAHLYSEHMFLASNGQSELTRNQEVIVSRARSTL